DTVARLGGDEFGIVLSKVNDRAGALQQAERLTEQIRQPFMFEQKELPLDASIGCAIYPDDGADLDRLIERADQAMYAIKRDKKEKTREQPR
ncbi:MAG TPA: GGDEF domain-containing protein, partial [Nevskiaceae bacterium]|nr:GGDEF domain-containing protein [Nevskiaceae bacterium]